MKTIRLIMLVAAFALGCSDSAKLQSQPKQPAAPPESSNFLTYLCKLRLPDNLSFCGERVPLEIPEVRERAEREFFLNLQSPGQIILYAKRAGRYFPLFEKILKTEGVPDDLKYLALAESALFMARSPKDAVGLWQFIPATGKRMGLQIDEYVDERRNPEKSTAAAVEYLRSGYKASGGWTLTAAGYNMGHENLRENLAFQNKDNFYDLYLNEETSRYILRIAIIKEILGNPAKYGLLLDADDVYTPQKTRTVEWSDDIPSVSEWATSQGTTYKDVKLLNPWILKRNLPRPKSGQYRILVPAK
ncbi:lytic transglycosylase domain-containing protein [Ignavibacteria bacterium]|nr:transglycosylase SLT domain-containing protein [Bacteroidota bacterium]MCZ2133052.1 transglycosylase SLT domain-containing protein [Bacteroidota bacterium]